MTDFNVVRGKRLRATRVDACGGPLAGPKNQIVTNGFVTVTYSHVWKDAEDLEQVNADGQNCVVDRTAPQLKWHTVELVLCNVATELIAMFTDLPLVLDPAGKPVGLRENRAVLTDAGVALEIWTGTGSGGCEVPTDDTRIGQAARVPVGYWVSPVIKEATLGDVEIGSSVSTFTLSGITAPAPSWGKGPYDVVESNAAGLPGRLATPFLSDEFIHVQQTFVPPPAVTKGASPVVLPTPYYSAA